MKLPYLVFLSAMAAPGFGNAADADAPVLRLSDGLQPIRELPADWDSRMRVGQLRDVAVPGVLAAGPFQRQTVDGPDITRPALPPNPRSLARLFDLTYVPVTSAPGAGSFGTQTDVIESIELAQALRLAVEFSRDVRLASSRLDTARAQTEQSIALLMPSLTMRHARGREVSSPASVSDPATGQPALRDGHQRIDTTFVLRQPVIDLPSAFEAMRRKELERSRELNLRSSEGEAGVVAVQAYLSLVSTRLQADLALEFENQLKELLEYLRQRADAGAATVSDLDRVRARVLTAYAARLEQDAAHGAAGIEFARLVNVLPKKIRLPEIRELGAIPSGFDEAVALAFKLNPDLAALQVELEAAQTDSNGALGSLVPRVDLEVSDFKVTNAGGDTGLQHDQRIMLVTNWAIFESGRSLKLHSERLARKDEAFYRLDDTRRRVVQTLSSQYATLTSVRDRIYSGYAELDALKSALIAVSERMLSGNQSLLDLLDVYDRAYQVRVRLVNLHAQEFISASQIIRNIYGRGNGEAANTGRPAVAQG